MILASCAHCGEIWSVKTTRNPDVLEGVCQDCQSESDAEKPLQFYWLPVSEENVVSRLPELPPDYLVS